MKWRHAEAWISLTTDTADGFELEAEFHIHDSPSVVAIIKGPTLASAGLELTLTRSYKQNSGVDFYATLELTKKICPSPFLASLIETIGQMIKNLRLNFFIGLGPDIWQGAVV